MTYSINKNYNPYVDFELRYKDEYISKPKPKKTRRVYKRNVALAIIYTILTGGLYGIFWQFEIAKETNGLTEDDSGFSPVWVVLFSILTLGIYGCYWAFKVGKKHDNFYREELNDDTSYRALYLVLHLVNYICPITSLISYAIMQAKMNEMLAVVDRQTPEGVFVKDSNLFNRPILSTLFLVFIVETFPQSISDIYHRIFEGVPGNPYNFDSGLDLIQNAIKNSADQIIYADTAFVIFDAILSILLIVLVLWWFKLRFKHANYTGVLVLRNFGRACLLGLPGLIFVALNVIGFDPAYFKFGIVLLGFVPAFTEEIVYRGMIIPNFMRLYNRSKGIWVSLFVSSFIFGLVHLGNVFAGADLGTSIFQACYAFCLGMLFASILIRTGNLWPCIILHGLTDMFAMMAPEAIQQGAVQTQAFVWGIEVIPTIVVSAFFLFWGIWLCRPKKHDEITSLWAEKWGDAIC